MQERLHGRGCSWRNSNHTEKGQLKRGVGSEKGANKALVEWATPRSLGPKEQVVGREVGCTELTGAVAMKTEVCGTRRSQEGEYESSLNHSRE